MALSCSGTVRKQRDVFNHGMAKRYPRRDMALGPTRYLARLEEKVVETRPRWSCVGSKMEYRENAFTYAATRVRQDGHP